MPLSEDDVREILRLIDESDVAELRIETDELSLHVVREVGPAHEAAAQPVEPAVSPRPVATRPEEAPADERPTIESPMLGTFYRAPAPGAPPFVDVGASIDEETVVCLIEVMKMMNAVHAGMSGTIVEVCAENAELVEAGEILFRVEPGS